MTSPVARQMHTLSLAPLDVESWYVSPHTDLAERLGGATAFLVTYPDGSGPRTHIVTAGHVLTGRHADTGLSRNGDDAVYPTELRVWYPVASGSDLVARIVTHQLYVDSANLDTARWLTHPSGPWVDVVALPIPAPPEESFARSVSLCWPIVGDLYGPVLPSEVEGSEAASEPIPLRIADRLFVVGFPFEDLGTWPTAIWTTAPIASEPMIRYNDQPSFLVDSRTRAGQSGAPVFLHLTPNDPVWVGGDVYLHEEQIDALVGVYSGRRNRESDLGMVWTTEALEEVLNQKISETPRQMRPGDPGRSGPIPVEAKRCPTGWCDRVQGQDSSDD